MATMNDDLRRTHAGMDAMAAVARQSLAGQAKQSLQGDSLASMSHTAALAVKRLDCAGLEQGVGKAEIAISNLEAIKAMNREIQNTGHLTYLKQHGAETDYEAIGVIVTKRYRTPAGKWRKLP